MRRIIKFMKFIIFLPIYLYKMYQLLFKIQEKTSTLSKESGNNLLLKKLEHIELQNCALMMQKTYNLDYDQMFDFIFYSKQYNAIKGKYPNVLNPKTFTEKMQAFKIFDRNSIYTKLADKYRVRDFIKEKGLETILIPILWDGTNSREIPFDTLPEKYVIKMNNGCGGNIFVIKDKMYISQGDTIGQNIDREIILKCLDTWRNNNYYYEHREWQYKDIKPHIIVERYIQEDKNILLPVDYKLWCFGGKFKYFHVFQERLLGGSFRDNFYDREWNSLNMGYGKKIKNLQARPKEYKELISIAEILADGFSFARVDLYVIKDKIYFGEMTFTPYGGNMHFQNWSKSVENIDIDFEIGKLWT